MSLPESKEEYNQRVYGSKDKYGDNSSYDGDVGWPEEHHIPETRESYNLRRYGSTDKYGDNSLYDGDVGW